MSNNYLTLHDVLSEYSMLETYVDFDEFIETNFNKEYNFDTFDFLGYTRKDGN